MAVGFEISVDPVVKVDVEDVSDAVVEEVVRGEVVKEDVKDEVDVRDEVVEVDTDNVVDRLRTEAMDAKGKFS